MSTPNITNRPWGKLAATLKLRRNLESALTPASVIGRKELAKGYESEAQFRERLAKSRAEHQAFRDELAEVYGLKSEKDAADLIVQLKLDEENLWKQCRPDLYS